MCHDVDCYFIVVKKFSLVKVIVMPVLCNVCQISCSAVLAVAVTQGGEGGLSLWVGLTLPEANGEAIFRRIHQWQLEKILNDMLVEKEQGAFPVCCRYQNVCVYVCYTVQESSRGIFYQWKLLIIKCMA